MKFSRIGNKFSSNIGIVELMNELGKALRENKDMIMMGGGNPSHIPAVQDYLRQSMKSLLDSDRKFEEMLGDYDGPKGNLSFRKALAELLKQEYNWDVTEDNIALTSGSQSAFFSLFNIFGGRDDDGNIKKILFPLTPEYIGYGDSSIEDGVFTSRKAKIEHIDQHTFKYHVDFEALNIDDTIAAICVSRPTNPTGNVITDKEIKQLEDLARKHDIPLIIDNAYGAPFPGIIFTDIESKWNESLIMCLSLSKLGMPGARTGIVIANKSVISTLASMNSVMSLAPGSFGAELALDLVESKNIAKLSEDVIKPYYHKKARTAIKLLHKHLRADIPWHIHKAEGAMFLWLWFDKLPITSQELYERLKDKNVLVVSGHHFFPGLAEDNWPHQHECIRMTYSSESSQVEQGIKIIAEEINNLYD
ncbi:valine--pyruvate transaminase [Lentisphaera araneosa HTCC2155]|uniref:Valine--pyruvate transaminase n=1 Tax=Lentisphaera araneosa HTCC2155 TaxID=313628 RepID=A6DKV6_9BACT|nr:valine--pyruvate transaminase [Lentisphaera araneosa]EDM27558.1 valine--pyruvate transaminase [Lentisphaera araneosa HTCC2155]